MPSKEVAKVWRGPSRAGFGLSHAPVSLQRERKLRITGKPSCGRLYRWGAAGPEAKRTFRTFLFFLQLVNVSLALRCAFISCRRPRNSLSGTRSRNMSSAGVTGRGVRILRRENGTDSSLCCCARQKQGESQYAGSSESSSSFKATLVAFASNGTKVPRNVQTL